MSQIRFSQPKGDFFSTLRSSVDNYFTENKISSAGNFQLYFKATVLITVYIAIYIALVTIGLPLWVGAIGAAAIGLLQAFIGFNVMHDACHDAFSTKKEVNYFFGLSMNALGSDAFLWRQKHNVIHHTYTNIDGADDDIAKTPFLRMSATQPHFKAHRFQHVYMFFLYAISTLFWIVYKDFSTYFAGRYTIEVAKMKPMDHFVFWSTKIVYFLLYLVIPIYVWGVLPGILGFVIMHAALGFVLSLVFQLAHVVENVDFESHDDVHTEIDNEWAVHQLATTTDFATNNKVVSWFLGGLNYQAVHHLFPRISHIHYPKLQSIIAKTCADFGVEYHSYNTMMDALASHYRHMRTLGNKAA